ncbi:LysR family transcriptional regulator [Nocardioides sp. WS12]|uniref:LysR family transcriptional regulator n=1 Tax=Nocardioides sp. WS12 TaxID=2486272 RepID=UPI0015FA02D3|nr:LysR family transcriptional regulator [Nocardioides sp. WS12]
MRIRDLEWVVVLAEHLHVTSASVALGVSQPTLSRALSRVEAEIGAVLFERVPGGLVISPNGELVVDASRELIGRYRRLLSEVEIRLDAERGTVRLAFLDSMATSLVPRILRGFHQEAPLVRVSLSQEPAHIMQRELAAGAVDLAITSARPPGDYGWVTLQDERLVVVVPPTHALRRRKRVDLSDLVNDQLITTPSGFGFRNLVDNLLADSGITMAISFESADLGTIEGLVAAGLGVAILPEAFAGSSDTIGLAIASPRARRTVGLTWRTDREMEPAAARFRKFVVDQALGACCVREI